MLLHAEVLWGYGASTSRGIGFQLFYSANSGSQFALVCTYEVSRAH